jgi:pyruvate formate lyase activating enzyme
MCKIPVGSHGNCRARYNHDGKLVSLVYGKPCAVHIDPVEKKPLFHFLPGSRIFSIATAGCNGHCLFCQNWEISQKSPEETDNMDLPPRAVVDEAVKNACPSIAYTYTDPNIFFEYALDTSKIAREHGLKNVLVTAGFLNEAPLRELCKVTDAANVDLKGDEKFYRDTVLAELKPVQDYIKIALEEGILVELTNLIVPTLNDSAEDIKWLVDWILNATGPDIPLHFSRFYPMYRLTNLYPTPDETLFTAAKTAYDMGMHYVYVGNIDAGEYENTRCPGCKRTIVRRRGYLKPEMDIVDGKCPHCSRKIYGVWR